MRGMMNHRMLSLFVFLFLMSATLYAETIKFNSIRTGGVGCPSETTSIARAPDLSSASIIFDRFESKVPVQLPNGSTRSINDIPCNVFIELGLPANHRLTQLEVVYDLRGATILDQGVAGSFKSFLMTLAGMSVPSSRNPRLVIEKQWLNTFEDQTEDFYVSHSQVIPVQSTCSQGQDRIMMHVQHHVETKILSPMDVQSKSGTIIMDSSDMRGGLRLSAKVEPCSPGGGSGGQVCRTVIVRGRPVQTCTNK